MADLLGGRLSTGYIMLSNIEVEIKLLLYKYILEIFIGLFVFGYIKNLFKKKWFVIVVFLADML